jgi:alkanesulfonate monooxygenase SsuD/methylene tetrahydromethanopterin reductase-like flavin-dependent oxidoreductase (luciferase family)
MLAKMIATLDVASHGRVDMGVGIGAYEPDYESTGVNFKTRGTQLPWPIIWSC